MVERSTKTRSACAYFMLALSCVLVACSFASLHPLQYGIEFNGNAQALRVDTTYKGGRRYLGLGHRFIKFPGRSMLVAFTNDETWKNTFREGWTSAFGADYVNVYDPVYARSGDGLQLVIQAVLTVHIGKGPFAVGEEGTVSEGQRQSLNRFFLNFGNPSETGEGGWMDTISGAIRSSIIDEAAVHNADQFYKNRGGVGKYVKERLAYSLQELEMTLMDVDLINIDYPERFVAAIQDTELAKQERQTAIFAKTEQIIRAVTKTEQARVFRETLEFEALKTGDASYLERSIHAHLLEYAITRKGDAYADVGDIYKELASNLSASLDFGNDDLLTWVWLNSLTDAEAAGLVYDAAQPFDFVDAEAEDAPGLALDADKYFEDLANNLTDRRLSEL
jgi:hypothetical protein